MKIARVTDCIFLWHTKEAKHCLEKIAAKFHLASLWHSVLVCTWQGHRAHSCCALWLLLNCFSHMEEIDHWSATADPEHHFEDFFPNLKKNQNLCFFSNRFKVITNLMLLLICGFFLLHSSAFFWLVSLLLSSVFWYLVRVITDNKDGPIQKYLLIFGVLLSVCIQELFRLAYYRLLK